MKEFDPFSLVDASRQTMKESWALSEEDRQKHANDLHDQTMRHRDELHNQSMRHRDEIHRQHMNMRDDAHRHNLDHAKKHKKLLSPEYLYGGDMAYNSVDEDSDDFPSADQNSQEPKYDSGSTLSSGSGNTPSTGGSAGSTSSGTSGGAVGGASGGASGGSGGGPV